MRGAFFTGRMMSASPSVLSSSGVLDRALASADRLMDAHEATYRKLAK